MLKNALIVYGASDRVPADYDEPLEAELAPAAVIGKTCGTARRRRAMRWWGWTIGNDAKRKGVERLDLMFRRSKKIDTFKPMVRA